MPPDSHNNGAGGDSPQKPPTSFSDIAKAHSFKDMRNVLKTEPCAREGLLYGMGVGTAVAVLRIFKGRSMVSAGNWGFVAFGVVAVVAKQLCHFQYAHQSAKLNTLFETRSKQALKVRGFEHSEADRPQEKHD